MKICAYCLRILEEHAFECSVCHKSLFGPIPSYTEPSPTGALMYASEHGHMDTIGTLLDKGVDVNTRDSKGATALMWASGNGHTAVVEQLLLRGANVDVRTNEGWTALMLASQEGHLAVIKVLLARGASVARNPNEQWPPLTLAAQEGHLEIVKMLIDEGADINARGSSGATALMMAAKKGHLGVTNFLLDKDSNVNEKADKGVTALMFASRTGHLDIVLALLAKGADLGAKSVDGITAADLAKEAGHEKVESVLRKAVLLQNRAAESEQSLKPRTLTKKHRNFRRRWQFWKLDPALIPCDKEVRANPRALRIFVSGYAVTPGSELHRRALELLPLTQNGDVNVQLPGADVIDDFINEWAVLGQGVVTNEQREAMYRREKAIGQALNQLGGIDLMRSFAYKLINAGLSYESDFFVWHGIGEWQN